MRRYTAPPDKGSHSEPQLASLLVTSCSSPSAVQQDAGRFFGLTLHLMRVHPRWTSVASISQLTFGPRFQVAGWHLASCCSASGSNSVPTPTTQQATSSMGRDGMLAMPRHERKAARKSRSFRRRQAPITRGQRRTLRELWPKYGLVMDFERR